MIDPSHSKTLLEYPLQWKENLCFEAAAYYENLAEDVRQAQFTIDLETYIFAEDSVGKHLVDELILAAKKGVLVRILVDGMGTPSWSSEWQNQIHHAGIQTKVYHPIPWSFWQWTWPSSPTRWIEKIVNLIIKLNRRNHRKVCIIDRRIAWVGSFNISKAHLSQQLQWHDTAIRVEGLNLKLLSSAFEKAWTPHQIRPRAPLSSSPFRINNTLRRRKSLYHDLLRRFISAQNRIWIVNAYFIPCFSLMKALIHSAKRGVDVTLLLPQQSDITVMPWISAWFYQELIESGVQIFEYIPGILHSKVVVIDEWCTVGSSNLNSRSLLHDLEVDVVLQQESSKQQLQQRFQTDLLSSQWMSTKQLQQRPWHQRLLGKWMLWLRYWL